MQAKAALGKLFGFLVQGGVFVAAVPFANAFSFRDNEAFQTKAKQETEFFVQQSKALNVECISTLSELSKKYNRRYAEIILAADSKKNRPTQGIEESLPEFFENLLGKDMHTGQVEIPQILMQDHDSKVEFKNIKIAPIDVGKEYAVAYQKRLSESKDDLFGSLLDTFVDQDDELSEVIAKVNKYQNTLVGLIEHAAASCSEVGIEDDIYRNLIAIGLFSIFPILNRLRGVPLTNPFGIFVLLQGLALLIYKIGLDEFTKAVSKEEIEDDLGPALVEMMLRFAKIPSYEDIMNDVKIESVLDTLRKSKKSRQEESEDSQNDYDEGGGVELDILDITGDDSRFFRSQNAVVNPIPIMYGATKNDPFNPQRVVYECMGKPFFDIIYYYFLGLNFFSRQIGFIPALVFTSVVYGVQKNGRTDPTVYNENMTLNEVTSYNFFKSLYTGLIARCGALIPLTIVDAFENFRALSADVYSRLTISPMQTFFVTNLTSDILGLLNPVKGAVSSETEDKIRSLSKKSVEKFSTNKKLLKNGLLSVNDSIAFMAAANTAKRMSMIWHSNPLEVYKKKEAQHYFKTLSDRSHYLPIDGPYFYTPPDPRSLFIPLPRPTHYSVFENSDYAVTVQHLFPQGMTVVDVENYLTHLFRSNKIDPEVFSKYLFFWINASEDDILNFIDSFYHHTMYYHKQFAKDFVASETSKFISDMAGRYFTPTDIRYYNQRVHNYRVLCNKIILEHMCNNFGLSTAKFLSLQESWQQKYPSVQSLNKNWVDFMNGMKYENEISSLYTVPVYESGLMPKRKPRPVPPNAKQRQQQNTEKANN